MSVFARIKNLRLVVRAIAVLSALVVVLIITLGVQFRAALTYENLSLPPAESFSVRQVGTELAAVDRAFERYLNNAGSYDQLLLNFDILYARLDNFEHGVFSQWVEAMVGHRQAVDTMIQLLRTMDQLLVPLEDKKPSDIQLFRQRIDNAVVIWNEVSQSLRDTQTDQNKMWNEKVVDTSLTIAGLMGLVFFFGLVIVVMMIRVNKEVFQTLTRERLLSRQLDQAAQAKDDFLAVMSHELRTPLNAICGFSDLLERSCTTDRQRQQVAMVRDSARHLESMLGDILSYVELDARMVCTNMHDFSLDSFGQTFKTTSERFVLEGRKGHHFIFLIEPSLKDISLHNDPLMLMKILTAFVDNAVKFSNGGEIKITITPSSSHHDHIRFYVIDQGIGIANDIKDRVFNVFVQGDHDMNREHEGSGMGLAIAARIAPLLSGVIGFKSLSDGTAFWLDVPLEDPNLIQS